MTDPNQAQHSQVHDGGGRCRDCNPGFIDAIKCRAEGNQARAKYEGEHIGDLKKAQEAYNGARAAYSSARDAQSTAVTQIKADIKCLLERLECLISDDEQERREIVGRIDRALGMVRARIKECPDGSKNGCYFTDDCEFDAEGCDPDDAPNRLEDIKRRTQKATDAFNDLIGVPAAIPTAVSNLQAEVAKISKDSQGEVPRDVAIALYAAALVASQHRRDIWRGFDNVNDYVNCVCHALTCMARGHTAIGILTGKLAVKKCQLDAKETECQHLRDKMADEVVATYLQLERQEQSRHAASATTATARTAGSVETAGQAALPETSVSDERDDSTAAERQAAEERMKREYYAL